MLKNKNQQTKKYIKYIIFLLVLIFIFLCILLRVTQNSNDSNNLTYDNLLTVRDVIEYYDSTYIYQEYSNEDGYSVDIYLIFKVLPYTEDEVSNEQYYNDIINGVAKVLDYKSFIMIDEENNLKVKVICKNNVVQKIIINDIEDYFEYMDSMISLKTYREIGITEFNVSSEILNNCIQNNWSSDIYFGNRTSIFDGYYIYSNEGIKVKTLKDKIYNIVFEKKYNKDVINRFAPGADFETIEDFLGEAPFKDEELNVIGYKGKEFYVFFTEKEISIYRIYDGDVDEFFELTEQYLYQGYKTEDLLEFMNQLTYMWPDYNEYEYTTSEVFISYPLKGIEIKINYDDTNGILLYNNIKSDFSKVERYLKNTNFISRLKIDSVFETEKRRVKKYNSLIEKCNEFYEKITDEEKQIIGESSEYYFYADTDEMSNIYSMKFIARNEENPNRELNDSFDSYLWADSMHLVYSKKQEGIFIYDLTNGNVQRILNGNEEFELKGIENAMLKYDNSEMLLQY